MYKTLPKSHQYITRILSKLRPYKVLILAKSKNRNISVTSTNYTFWIVSAWEVTEEGQRKTQDVCCAGRRLKPCWSNIHVTVYPSCWNNFRFAYICVIFCKILSIGTTSSIAVGCRQGCRQKKQNSIFKDIIQIEVDPLPPTLFLTNLFLTKCWSCWPPSLP